MICFALFVVVRWGVVIREFFFTMNKVFGAFLSILVVGSLMSAGVMAEEPPVVPIQSSSISDVLGPIQDWQTSQGRVSGVDLGEITPMTFDWFQELVSNQFPDLNDIIIDSEYGVLSIGNAYCASGIATKSNLNASWSVCVYQIDGVQFFSISTVSFAKGSLSDSQVGMIQEFLGLSFQGALSLPTEPIEIK